MKNRVAWPGHLVERGREKSGAVESSREKFDHDQNNREVGIKYLLLRGVATISILSRMRKRINKHCARQKPTKEGNSCVFDVFYWLLTAKSQRRLGGFSLKKNKE